jgi:hypothetical protein
MADVPNELVRRRRENVVKGESEFDDAEIRTEMAAMLGELGDQFLAEFFREFD